MKDFSKKNKNKISIYQKQYRKKNKKVLTKKKKENYNKNKDKILNKNKKYRIENRDKLIEYSKLYYINNKENLILQSKKRYSENKYRIKEKIKLYQQNNKEKINIKKSKRNKIRRQVDPSYKIRKIMSRAINLALKQNNSIKNNIGCLSIFGKDYPSKIKTHIESLFEAWMTWENQSTYNSKTWDDNDASTWTWQLDHIIPHSFFNYSSIKDIECKKAWALSNLRPLSSKENLLKSNNIDHKLYEETIIKILKELETKNGDL
jgi:hypothetical protein